MATWGKGSAYFVLNTFKTVSAVEIALALSDTHAASATDLEDCATEFLSSEQDLGSALLQWVFFEVQVGVIAEVDALLFVLVFGYPIATWNGLVRVSLEAQ